MLLSITNIVIGLIGLGIMVFIHEMGHFLAARAVGVEVEAFALGWGPTIWRRQGKKTEYRLALLPIGGYCKMKGEQDMTAAIEKKSEFIETSPGSIFAAKPWKRIVISFAGPLINLLFALVVSSLIWTIGYNYKSFDNRIVLSYEYPDDSLDTNSELSVLNTTQSPAASAGLRTGDRIVAVDNRPVDNFNEIRRRIVLKATQSIPISYERNGKLYNTTITPIMDKKSGAGIIGIREYQEPIVSKVEGAAARDGLLVGDRIVAANGKPTPLVYDITEVLKKLDGPLLLTIDRGGKTIELSIDLASQGLDKKTKLGIEILANTYRTPQYNLGQAINRAYEEAQEIVIINFYAISFLFQGLDATSVVQGPFRIIPAIGNSFTGGFAISLGDGLRYFFQMLSFISIALFFGNLLPIPALDGGQILMYAWEGITRRPLRLRTIQRYQIVGMVLVFSLLLFALYGDILSMFKK